VGLDIGVVRIGSTKDESSGRRKVFLDGIRLLARRLESLVVAQGVMVQREMEKPGLGDKW
jgi:hypothetical protein